MRVDSSRVRGSLRITALAVLLGTSGMILGYGLADHGGAAFAEDDGDGGQGAQGPGQGGAGQGEGGPGSQAGQGNQGGQGQGQGGPSADSEGKVPQAGSPAGSGGGKPPWAQEGIPEVELGRLRVARSPDQVLDRALAEALASFTPAMAAFHSRPLDEVILSLSTEFESQSYIDSPLRNLALFKGVLEGSMALPGVSSSPGTLAAVFLGTASDKTIPISTDTVRAVTTILGVPLPEGNAATLAAQAEAVRVAILAGHA
jgi:hypothetical protein